MGSLDTLKKRFLVGSGSSSPSPTFPLLPSSSHLIRSDRLLVITQANHHANQPIYQGETELCQVFLLNDHILFADIQEEKDKAHGDPDLTTCNLHFLRRLLIHSYSEVNHAYSPSILISVSSDPGLSPPTQARPLPPRPSQERRLSLTPPPPSVRPTTPRRGAPPPHPPRRSIFSGRYSSASFSTGDELSVDQLGPAPPPRPRLSISSLFSRWTGHGHSSASSSTTKPSSSPERFSRPPLPPRPSVVAKMFHLGEPSSPKASDEPSALEQMGGVVYPHSLRIKTGGRLITLFTADPVWIKDVKKAVADAPLVLPLPPPLIPLDTDEEHFGQTYYVQYLAERAEAKRKCTTESTRLCDNCGRKFREKLPAIPCSICETLVCRFCHVNKLKVPDKEGINAACYRCKGFIQQLHERERLVLSLLKEALLSEGSLELSAIEVIVLYVLPLPSLLSTLEPLRPTSILIDTSLSIQGSSPLTPSPPASPLTPRGA